MKVGQERHTVVTCNTTRHLSPLGPPERGLSSRNFWSGVIFGPGRTKITAFLVRCHSFFGRLEILSRRQNFLGNNVARAPQNCCSQIKMGNTVAGAHYA